MKRLSIWAVALAVLLVWGTRFLMAKDPAPAAEQTLSGHVVCLNCYLAKDASGSDHAKCAKACFGKGMSAALKVGDQLYLLEGSKGQSSVKGIKGYAEKDVKVTGTVFQKEGLSVIQVKKVEKQ